jgi:UPF0716 protein FxsA
MLAVVLLLIVAPIIELYVIVQVAGVIGVLPTVLAVVAISVAGAWLLKVEGLGVLRRMGRTLDEGQIPADEAVDGLIVSTGGVLMLLPGFISGAIGLLLMVPPIRALVRPFVRGRVRRRLERTQRRMVVFGSGPGDPFGSASGGAVYDVDSRPRTDPGSGPGTPPHHAGPPELEA